MKKPLLLALLDGYGLSKERHGNALVEANTPNIHGYFRDYPMTTLKASGLSVGLPEGQMGNSEVGHLNIGAGRIVYQELTRISKSLEDGDFYTNDVLVSLLKYVKENKKKLHFMGLLSDGGVHSHTDHLYGLLKASKDYGLKDVYVHGFLDGRDTPPQSALHYVKALEEEMKTTGVGKIATLIGRYYAMDRDQRYDRVEKAYSAMTLGTECVEMSAEAAVLRSYDEGVTDEFILPILLDERGLIEEGDGVLFFNFRPDRGRELTDAFTNPNFDGFQKTTHLAPCFTTFTQYDSRFDGVEVMFPPALLTETLGEVISKAGLKQLRIAETEKYAHVTYFLNGGVEEAFSLEDRILIPSPKVATYDLQPEMSAYEVVEQLLPKLPEYDFIVVNFANCDMVGHTGDFEATKLAAEAVDVCLKKIVDGTLSLHGTVIITSDHGNGEEMRTPQGEVHTAHSVNDVPFVIVSDHPFSLKEGLLSDIAPTLLQLLRLQQPVAMTGQSLLINKEN